MEEEKVSVIVPVYNVEKYLRQCVDSIIAQTYRNLEIILVDDGSPDNCGAICDEYAEKDSRIQVIHQKNSGLSVARNSGLNISTGEYIAFIDSDDWVADNFIEKLHSYAGPNTLTVCNLIFWTSETNNHIFMKPRASENINRDEFWKRTMGEECTAYIVAWSKLYPSKVFNQLRFPTGLLHEDEAILHNVLDQVEEICVVYEPLYFYRQNEDSIMGQGFSPKRLDGFVAWAERLKYFRINNLRLHEDALSQKYWERYKDQIIAVDQFEDPAKHRARAVECYKNAFPSLMRAKSIKPSQKLSVLAMRIHPSVFQGMWRIIGAFKKQEAKNERKSY